MLRDNIGKKLQGPEGASRQLTHWDFVLKEMAWMAEDFEREHKSKNNSAKKMTRACKKHLNEKNAAREKAKKVRALLIFLYN